MIEELYTVELAADRLKLHPKTILRFIREGRLRATKVGKSFRILRADLDALAGVPPRTPTPLDAASVTCIVDVPGVEAELARKWARQVTSALNARSPNGNPLRADVVHEPERSHVKFVLVGAPDDTLNLLGQIRVWLEQSRPSAWIDAAPVSGFNPPRRVAQADAAGVQRRAP
jgi:excisionase family DNA binding protein